MSTCARVLVVVASLAAGGCRTTDRARTAAPAAGHSWQWHFDDATAGQLPGGWRLDATSPTSDPAEWSIQPDPTAPSPPNVLALTHSTNYDGTYNLAIANGASMRDVELSVHVKAVAGEEDQGGGPIWRCIDEDNYYVCRFNPLEGNYRVYVVADGKRRQLASHKMELEAGRWYTLGVRMAGDKIECSLDGAKLLEATDATLPGPGRVGLWTKADAVTSFDDLHVTALDP